MATYAFSDIHGDLELFRMIQKHLKEDDVCYCLGDCIDRGPHGWTILKEVLRDERFKMLKGNHEDLLVRALECYYCDGDYDPEDYQVWLFNGGRPTIEEMEADTNLNLGGWVEHIRRLPLYTDYINADGIAIHLSHAGFTLSKEFLRNIHTKGDELLWDRDHITDICEPLPREIVVHGHTPIQMIVSDDSDMKPSALWYSKNSKVCIDYGTPHTGAIVLLDLDTFEEHVFAK